MPVTPTGPLSLPLAIAQNMIAASGSFQTWTGTGNTSAALARVFIPQAPVGATKPFACVDYARSYSSRRSGDVDSNFFEDAGSISILFRDAVSQSADQDAEFDFLNKVGAVLQDLKAAAGVAVASLGTLQIDEYRLVKGPWRPEEDERATPIGDFYELELELAFRAPSP